MQQREMLRILIAVFAIGCAVSEPEPQPTTMCVEDEDCASGSTCEAGICTRVLEDGCVDGDGDGFGLGLARADCARCLEAGLCAEDCDDSDAGLHPEAADVCDGIDNNCDGEIDEAQMCASTADCAADTVLLPGCVAGTCQYLPPDQSAPGCDEPVRCLDAQRTASPACL